MTHSHTLPARFILFRRQWDAARGKWDKIPCDHQGQNINHLDPSRWGTYDSVLPHARFDESRPDLPYGVAWVLNGDGWFFLDLDDCGPEWTNEAVAIYTSFGGALGEVSTSGKGLHIFGRCDPAQLKDRRNRWGGWLEFYTDGRFVALSQHGLQPIGGQWSDKDWTHQLLSVVPEREHLGELPDGVDPAYTGPDDDDELLAMMLRSGSVASKFGTSASFKHLWEADHTVLTQTYPGSDGGFDHSAADAALMGHLAFWTGKDMPRMDRLFRRSALMRDKYEKRADYRRDTIQNAARLGKRVYDVPRTNTVTTESRESYLTIPEMIERFTGCVYVRDDHKVLVPDGALLKPEQFNVIYGGFDFQMRTDNTKPTRKAFEAFTECNAHEFPRVTSRTFRPDLPFGTLVGDQVNTYVPAAVRRVAGDPGVFLDFLHRFMPLERDRQILLSWMAAVVQNPGRKVLWAPVLQGTQGNGKSLIGKIMEYCVGEQYVHRPRAKELGTQFNGFLEEKLLMIVEEIHMSGRREILDDLKMSITETRLPIRRMHQTEVNVHVPANWMFMTNYKDAVIKEKNDRRYAVFFTHQQNAVDVKRDFPNPYFPDLWDWLRGEGFAIVAEYLHRYIPVPEFNPVGSCQFAPNTSSTAAAVTASTGGYESEIIEAVESDTVGFRGGWISTWHLERLFRDRGFKITRPRMGQMLADMGYEQVMRAPRPVAREEGKRPVLWRLGGGGEFDDYMVAQYG